MGSLGWPLEALANSAPNSETTSWDETGAASLTNRPLPAGIHDIGPRNFHDAGPDLSHVMDGVHHPKIVMAQDTDKNYVGEITLNTQSSSKRPVH